MLIAGDLVAVSGATVAGDWLTEVTRLADAPDASAGLWRLLLSQLLVWLIVARLVRLYELTLVAQTAQAVLRTGVVAVLTVVASVWLTLTVPELGGPRLVGLSLPLLGACLLAWRYAAREWLRQPGCQIRALVVERVASPSTMRAALRQRGRHDFVLVWPDERGPGRRVRRKGAWSAQQLLDWVDREKIQEVFIDPRCRVIGTNALSPELRQRHIATADLTALHTALFGRDASELVSEKRVFARRYSADRYGAWRDSMDCLVACFLLVILGPLLVLACIAIALESRGNPIYVQRRVGRYGREFSMFKLRTMGCSAESDGPHWAQRIDPRVTRVGTFLRRSHIDEIPQLWNVMRGEMSMIGPRPERPEFVSWLSDRLPMYSARHHIRPGITGWAQVNLGYAASARETARKLEYDLFYVRRRSPLLDLAIVLGTVMSVARMSGR